MLLGWCSLGDGHASTMFAWWWTPSDGWPSDDGLAIYGPVMMTWWGWPGSDDLKCCQLGTRWRPGDDDLWRWRPGDADLGKNRILWRNESPCQKKKNCRIRVLDSPHFQRSRACWAEKKNLFFRLGLKPMPEDASRRELSKSVLTIEKGALCVELWPCYCSIRILVPMSYLFLAIQEHMAKKLYMAHVGHGQ